MKRYSLSLLLAVLVGSSALAQNGFQRTAQGAQYKVFTHNNSQKIKVDDVITFNVIQKTERDSVLFNSFTAGQPIKLQVQATQNVGDLMQVFQQLTAKDSALVRVPTDSVFAGHEEARPPFLPKGSSMIFVLKIEKVQSLNDAIAERNALMEKMKADEKDAAAKYIAAHNLKLNTTASGLKYVITRASAKRKVVNGDTLLVNYAGRNTADQLFDTSIETLGKASGLQRPVAYEPLKLVVGQGKVIKGWDEGLLLLNEGSKATFVIPSNLGYGAQGAGGAIGPFSTLIFDIEVVKVIPPKAKSAGKTATGKKAQAKAGAKTQAKKPAAPAKKKS